MLAKELQKMTKGHEGPSVSREGETKRLWSNVWSLGVKKKIQHFLWRAIHDRLPVATNLKKRGVEVDVVCPQCGEEKETVEHLMFNCEKTKRIWELAPVGWDGLHQ